MMKLVLAILRDEDSEKISHALVQDGFRVTRIASTGGFLRRGNTTLFIGVEEDKVDQAIATMRNYSSPPGEPGDSRVTLFVLNVAQYEQF